MKSAYEFALIAVILLIGIGLVGAGDGELICTASRRDDVFTCSGDVSHTRLA